MAVAEVAGKARNRKVVVKMVSSSVDLTKHCPVPDRFSSCTPKGLARDP